MQLKSHVEGKYRGALMMVECPYQMGLAFQEKPETNNSLSLLKSRPKSNGEILHLIVLNNVEGRNVDSHSSCYFQCDRRWSQCATQFKGVQGETRGWSLVGLGVIPLRAFFCGTKVVLVLSFTSPDVRTFENRNSTPLPLVQLPRTRVQRNLRCLALVWLLPATDCPYFHPTVVASLFNTWVSHKS